MRTSNPALNDKVFDLGRSTGDVMTINGTVNRTGILICLLMFTAIFSWDRAYSAVNPGELYPWLIGSGIAGFVVALITVFKKTAAPITAPIYAAIEGILLGILSAFYEMQFPGLVFQAILLTVGESGESGRNGFEKHGYNYYRRVRERALKGRRPESVAPDRKALPA